MVVRLAEPGPMLRGDRGLWRGSASRRCLAVAAAMLVMAQGVETSIPHRRPRYHSDSAVSSRVMQQLGVAEAQAQAVREGSAERDADIQQQFLLPGFFEGIRIKVFDDWFDSANRTCQPVNPQTRRGEASNTKDPQSYYASSGPATVSVFNRDAATPAVHVVECRPAYVLSQQHKSYLRTRVIPKLVRQLSYLVAPHFKGSGTTAPISGNACLGQCVRCMNDHFIFPLAAPYTYPGQDLLLFVVAEPDLTASYASPCMFGDDGRPTAVLLNIAPNKLPAVGVIPSGPEKLHVRVLQSMIHALGFDPSMFASWKQGAWPTATVASVSGASVNVVRTPAVKAWVNTEHFLCAGHPKGGTGALEGAELEDALDPSGRVLPFWESRLFRGDVMTILPDIESDRGLEVPVVSGLTLAVLADTGWYAVNTKLAKPLKWLREQPCSTATAACTTWDPRYTCARTETQPLCSPDFTSVAQCSGLDWPSGAIPDKFRRDGVSINWGGASSLMDFCPFRNPGDTLGASCLVARTSDPDCQNGPCREYQVRGATSRCFESNLRYAAFSGQPEVRGTCIPHECVRVGVPLPGQPQQWRVVLHIAAQQYSCDGTVAEVGPAAGTAGCSGAVLQGTVKCPNARELCEESGTAVTRSCDPLEDCNGRGVCSATGDCVCFSDLGPDGNTLYGMYAGPRCERCAEGYYGNSCKEKKCPVDPVTKAMCHGHGDCVTGQCQCHMNSTAGYWSNATACSTCFTGYTGGTCKLAVCDPAVTGGCQKGVCDATTKRCKCYSNNAQGYWELGHLGLCDRCIPGYDIYQSCKVKIGSYFGCHARIDTIAENPCVANCDEGMAVPQRVIHRDERGCAFTKPSPSCARSRCRFVGRAGNVTGSRPGAPSGCPTPSVVAYDCQGYPNLYHDCWLLDECGCESPKRPRCIVGTDSRGSPDAYDPVAVMQTPSGSSDIRPSAAATSQKECRCPSPGLRPLLDCWGPTDTNSSAPGGVQVKRPPPRRRVVVFEPQQMFEEDFCHCTSPPIPRCSDETRPEWLPERAQGAVLSCTEVLRVFGCPDWDYILNVGRRRNATEPDRSLIDCDGWPPPKLHSARDPCGCPFPQFKCLEGTMGVCGERPDCPRWDPLPPINCVDQMPPVLTLHAPHPCGCPPPPSPACIPGTNRQQCSCQPNGITAFSSEPCSPLDVEWVDCKGQPLELPTWAPFAHYPEGDPFVNTCDPCPGCSMGVPLRRCLPGTDVALPAVDNVVRRPCNAKFSPSQCQRWPAPCPVDCQGRPQAPEPDFNPDCECPPAVPNPPCLPGTDGSPPHADFRSVSCGATPQVCGEYACGGAGHDLEAVAAGLGYRGDYSTQAREAVLLAVGGTRTCVQEGQCGSDYHCAAGFHCGFCGFCLAGGKQAYSGCLADRASCGNYRCDIECDTEGIARLRAGQRDARCKERCFSDSDCKGGALCSHGVYSRSSSAGAAAAGRVRVMGSVGPAPSGGMPSGIPGANPQANIPPSSLADVPYDYIPLRDYGECFVPEQPDREAVAYCYSHDDCGEYACGTDNRQVIFVNSRCMGSCHVNAHCSPGSRCVRASGRCVRVSGEGLGMEGGDTLPDGPTCDLQPHTHCAPYWCGRRGLPPSPGAVCPTSCVDDSECQPFHECVRATLAELKEEHRTAANSPTCDRVTGLQSPAGAAVTRGQMDAHPEAQRATRGECKPLPQLRKRAQSAEGVDEQQAASPFALYEELAAARTRPLLTVPAGGGGGVAEDPNTQLWQHAPFAPPPPVAPRPLGTAVRTAASECFPYVAVAHGITFEQIVQMKATAASGSLDHNTGRYIPLPVCKHFCASDADCVGGHFCTAPPAAPVTLSAAGNRVVGGHGDPDLGMQGADESPNPAQPRRVPLAKGQCQAKRGLATACRRDLECGSGHCWQGVCCNTACTGVCRTCSRMGVCGWVAPHTGSPQACPQCNWCEYVPDEQGAISPASPLECVPIPEGLDPAGHCGPHAVCNGEGACLAADGWGGQGDTCAAGQSGPNCIDENVHYRTVAVEVPYSAELCTPRQVAQLSASPALSTFGARAVTSVASRGASSINALNGPPASYVRRLSVVDRRPRQWAQRVLGVSSHSRFGCSNVLFEPSRSRAERVHGESQDAWAPGQYVATPDGSPDEHPEKRYFPWSDCVALLTQGACVDKVECAWHATPPPGYCHISAAAEDASVTPAGLVQTPDGASYDLGSIPTPQPYEFIELEFDTPIFIESVVVHESFHPGSIVKIETQPAPGGSAAVAGAGGAAYATDLSGVVIPSTTVATPSRVGGTTVTATCPSLTPQGMAVCVSDVACFWLSGECRTAQGTCQKIGEESCKVRELEGLCHWDTTDGSCLPGRRSGCYPLVNYDESRYTTRCAAFNDLTTYPAERQSAAKADCGADTRCQWTTFTASFCTSTSLSCSSQNGKPTTCVQPCLWNSTTAECSDTAFPNGGTRVQYCASITNVQECGGHVQCTWVQDLETEGCKPMPTTGCSAAGRDACRQMGPCEWVEPPTTTPEPNVFTSGCPRLPAFNNTASARYVEQAGSAVVSLTCNSGYQQQGTSTCDPVAAVLQGTTACVPMACPDYPAPSGMRVVGYTESPPFGAKEQYSTPMLECVDGSNVTGSMPVCQNGAFVGKPPTCTVSGVREAETLVEDLRAPSTAWWVPEVDFSSFASRIFPQRGGAEAVPEAGREAIVQEDALYKECIRSPTFVPDAAVPGDMLDWTELCSQQTTEGLCLHNDADATPGTAGHRAGRCAWQTKPTTGDTVVPLGDTSPYEGATYGGLTKSAFQHKDMGPVYDTASPMPGKAETKQTPSNIRCEDLPFNTSLNPNAAGFVTIWERSLPNFIAPPRYRELVLDVGQVTYKSKVVRITMAPTSSGRSMIDAVAIVGYSEATAVGLRCKGEIWRSPVRDGTRASANVQVASVVSVPCNGRGRCGPRGCECFGNFYGEGCETCKLGFTGSGCDVPLRVGCEEVAFEDLSSIPPAELLSRWKFANHHRFTSRGLHWSNFGSSIKSPIYNLGDHTHVQLDLGLVMVDVPLSDDCGIVVAISTNGDPSASSYQVIHTAACQ